MWCRGHVQPSSPSRSWPSRSWPSRSWPSRSCFGALLRRYCRSCATRCQSRKIPLLPTGRYPAVQLEAAASPTLLSADRRSGAVRSKTAVDRSTQFVVGIPIRHHLQQPVSLIASRLSSTATCSSVHSAARRRQRRAPSNTVSEICITLFRFEGEP
jgi:hypothetical protein